MEIEHHTAFISAGSNLGDKLENCKKGIAALRKSGGSIIKDLSRFYKTEPVDYKDQAWFVNAVVKIKTTLEPFELLRELKSIQRDAGSTSDPIRFGPRLLDLDIVMYDDCVINSSELTIPHPRMHKRRFVLKPICDIDPKMMHPVLKKEMRYLLDSLGDNEQRIVQL